MDEAPKSRSSTVPLIGEARRRFGWLLSDLLSREEHAVFVQSLADDPELGT